MSKKRNDETVQEIVNTARETFDLGDFLRGRSIRTKTQRVFTDEVTGEKIGGYEKSVRQNEDGFPVPYLRSWGLVADLAKVQDEIENHDGPKTAKAYKDLKAREKSITDEIRALTEVLLETALDIELQAIPTLIKKDAWRAAKKALGINGKVPEAMEAEIYDEHVAQILARSVVSVTKHGTGEKNEGISIEGARSLRGLLPDSEWDKLENTMNELIAHRAIGEQAVADVDF